MCAILQFDRLASQQSEIGLVNQGRALQGVVRPLGLQVVMSETAQLLVDKRHESA